MFVIISKAVFSSSYFLKLHGRIKVRIVFFILPVLLLTLSLKIAHAQFPTTDTISLSLDTAESLFIKNNLQLLSQKYNVDASQALILQAKLYPNPNIGVEQGAYNTVTKQWFDLNKNGEQAYQLSQLILLSRKIHKQTAIAETNFKLARDNLYDLLRTLKFALRSTYYNIYYLEQTAKVYDEEIRSIQIIVNAYNQVKAKGYVSEAEIALIQAQLYSLQNEYQTLVDNINDQQSQLRLLLQDTLKNYYKPVFNTDIVKINPLAYSYKTMLDSALLNRTDMMIAKDNLLLSKQTYTLQKALAVPDITLGASLDRQGSYIINYNAINLNIDIPVFNRNQGNIKNALILIDNCKTQLLLTKKTSEEQVSRGLQKAIDAERLYKGVDSSFAVKFDTLANEMMKNYMKRNVNLLTFLTFYDAYKQNIIQLNTIYFNKVIALENLNYITGTNFFSYKH